MRLLPRILADEDELDRALDHREDDHGAALEAEPAATPLHWGWYAALATASAVPRLLYLFVFSDPENPGAYGDVWHHWQIAYLTRQIGLSAPGGPRLWDLKGLDYIWGVLHPLLMVVVFDLTGSIDIVLTRLVSLLAGVATVVLLFHLSRQYWGTQVGVGVALFASLLPTGVMNDASGMVEPLGVALCLAGVTASTRRGGFWAGLAWGLAIMARAEAWIFSLGLVVASLLRRPARRWVPLVAAYAAVLLIYMKLLLDQTGNPIYPLWWNFFATAVGQWQPASISPGQASVRPVLAVLVVAAAIGLVWSLWKRPRSYLLLTFGYGYWVFVAGMFGFTAYLSTWVWWLPISRRFEFPVLFAAVLLTVALLRWMPVRYGSWALPIGWGAVAATLVLSQILWLPIQEVMGPTEATWQTTLAESRDLGAWYNQPQYAGHALTVPADRPDITYALARFGNVDGKHLVSEMYGPFAYLPAGYSYSDHIGTVNTQLECWFSETDTRLIAIPRGDPNYDLMLRENPGWFTAVGTLPSAGWQIEAVSAPKPTADECRAARSAG